MLKKIFNWLFKKSDFAGKHGKIISSFSKAAEDARILAIEMQIHINEKEQHMAKIATEIQDVSAVMIKTENFGKRILNIIGDEEVTPIGTPIVVESDSKAGDEAI